jgi:hypothetical protein
MHNRVCLPIHLVMEVERKTIVAPVRREREREGHHGHDAQEEQLCGAADRRAHVFGREVVEWRR